MLQPEDDSWVAVVYASEDDGASRLGTALVIDGFRLLTCLHVVATDPTAERVWVAFPKAAGIHRNRWPAAIVNIDLDLDVAVLRLSDGLPLGVAAPLLRNPSPHALRDKRWWAFGFAGSRRGNSAYGVVGESLGDGYIRVDTHRTAVYRLQPGFSGGGLWSPDFEAVVGMIVTADDHGNGEAITFHQIDLCFPDEKFAELTRWTASEAGETALAAWGWTLERDPEGVRHWNPKGRGVSGDSERGFRFRGRSEALTAITKWLSRENPDRRALVVTGSPGVGKSAVLGRIVTTADANVAASLPADDRAVRAVADSVSCAVHAKGKTALEVATEIARAASAALPDDVEDFAPALRAALVDHGGRRFNVIMDALDESASPEQARIIISKIILPLVETCSDVGAQVIIGARPRFGDIDLLAAFGESFTKLDLDDPKLFSDDDLAAYALATLRLEGDERAGNPYADNAAAHMLARRIAELSDRNFLVAGLIARAHGLHDQQTADPALLSFTASVDAAMHEYIQRLTPVGGVPAELLLTAVAFAEAPGISLDLWQTAVEALSARRLTTQQLARFARSRAASFLIESTADAGTAVFRLFHQALNDALLRARAQIAMPVEDQRALTHAFIRIGKRYGWDQAPDYLLRSLPAHASAAGLIDDLLAEDAFLLHADLRRLIPLADYATSKAGRRRSRLLRLTPRAISANSATRTAMFSVSEMLEDLGRAYTMRDSPAPYRAVWAAATPRTERSVLEGHTDWVNAVCAFSLGGRPLLASGGSDETVRIWDPATGTEHTILPGHNGGINALCAFSLDGRDLLASGGDDMTVRIWDPATGTEHTALPGHTGPVRALCAFTLDGRTLLASGSSDETVRIWDPATGTEHTILPGHNGGINALCAFSLDGRDLLASGGDDEIVRIWDPATGTEHTALPGHTGWINALGAFIVDGRPLLASGSDDMMVRIWDPATGTEHTVLAGHTGWVNSLCWFTLDGRDLLASGGDDMIVRIWDPATGTEHTALPGHTGGVRALCAFTVGDRILLASGGSDDMTVRIWDPSSDSDLRNPTVHSGWVNSLCSFMLDGRDLLASGGDDEIVRIWDPATGTEHTALPGHTGPVRALCAFTLDGRTLLASGSSDETVRIWDPATGTEHTILPGHNGGINALCAFSLDGRDLLASGGDDEIVRIWDPATGTEHTALPGHTGPVRALCAFTLDGRTLLASGSSDETVRIWDPATGTEYTALYGHRLGINAICAFTLDGRTLLASGSDDKTVRIWDPTTGTEEATRHGYSLPVNALCAFIADGSILLASGSDDRTIQIWPSSATVPPLITPVHNTVSAIEYWSDILFVALSAGLLAIRINPVPDV